MQSTFPTRKQALEYVAYVVDDAGSAQEAQPETLDLVRERGSQFAYPSKLVGWQCGFEPLFVAVHSYLDVELTDDEAIEIASDFLAERGWFAGEPKEPDYVI